MRIADLPFVERPVLELLHFDEDRVEVDLEYAGYGWARVPAIWLDDGDSLRRVDDALVLALHSSDVGEARSDDVELEFELPGAEPVTVLASRFLDVWLPKLPHARAIVLAMCNPHRAVLRAPQAATVPIYYASGDVEAWLAEDEGDRIELVADGSWARLDRET